MFVAGTHNEWNPEIRICNPCQRKEKKKLRQQVEQELAAPKDFLAAMAAAGNPGAEVQPVLVNNRGKRKVGAPVRAWLFREEKYTGSSSGSTFNDETRLHYFGVDGRSYVKDIFGARNLFGRWSPKSVFAKGTHGGPSRQELLAVAAKHGVKIPRRSHHGPDR